MAISGGMINNPKRSLVVNMNIDAVRKRVKKIHSIYTSIDSSYPDNVEDDFLNVYEYKIKDGGLSFGTKAIIQLHEEENNKTKIKVELQRMVGSYDTDNEVTDANKQMSAIFKSLSILSQKTDEELNSVQVNECEQIETTSTNTIACVIGIGIFVIYMLL